MTHVVAEPCVRCKFTDCVEVCPVDCFREGENLLVIDPDECIDCGACVPACPVAAIYPEEELPAVWEEYLALNERLAAIWPPIESQRAPLPDAEEWRSVQAKRDQLSEEPGPGR